MTGIVTGSEELLSHEWPRPGAVSLQPTAVLASRQASGLNDQWFELPGGCETNRTQAGW